MYVCMHICMYVFMYVCMYLSFCASTTTVHLACAQVHTKWHWKM